MFGFLRSKRFWKRLVIGLGLLVAIALIANGFMAWQTERRLQAKVAAIRAAGDPASISDLAPEPIPDDQNAAILMERLGPRLDAFSKEYGRFSETPLSEAFDERVDKGEPPMPEQIAAIRAILDKYPDIPAGLAAAAECEMYASTADFSVDHQNVLDQWLKNQIGRVRTAARFLEWRSQVLLAEGKNEEAVEQGIELLRIARLYDAEPLLVNYLVGVAVRGFAVNMLYDALGAGAVRPELHAAVEKELALHDTPQRFVHALKTDRAYSASVVAEAGVGTVIGENKPFYFDLVAWSMKRLFMDELDYLDTHITTIGTTWPNPNNQVGRGGLRSETDLGVMADLMIPALQAAYNAEARIVAVMRALRIFNALTLYHTTNGREASGLGNLNLPKESTIDPYTGEPLKLKHTDDGWVIYSVMENGMDDGGDFKELKDFGVAPRKLRGTE